MKRIRTTIEIPKNLWNKVERMAKSRYTTKTSILRRAIDKLEE